MRLNLLVLIFSVVVLSACGVGAEHESGHPSDEDKTTLGSSWDQMKWDKGKWK
ncbi:MAG: hypothetical protein OEZ43_06140 [Gammaproteobacteria bacterium]|nr:hypothetical protein [Gammaproteobacteria bacterium]